MNHSFNTNIAKEVGLIAATILENFSYWLLKNRSENKHFHKGNHWTYHSARGLTKYFDYLTERQIKHAIQKLREAGYLIVDNFNKSPYDKTNWYAMTEKAFKLIKPLDNFVQSEELACPSNTIYKQNINISPLAPQREEDCFFNLSFKDDKKFKEIWKEWEAHAKEIKKKISKTQLKALVKTFEKWGVDKTIDNIEKSILRGYNAIIDLSEQTKKQDITLELLIKAYKWQINADNYNFNDLSDIDRKIIKSKSIEEFKNRCFDYDYICNELNNKTSKLRKAIS